MADDHAQTPDACARRDNRITDAARDPSPWSADFSPPRPAPRRRPLRDAARIPLSCSADVSPPRPAPHRQPPTWRLTGRSPNTSEDRAIPGTILPSKTDYIYERRDRKTAPG